MEVPALKPGLDGIDRIFSLGTGLSWGLRIHVGCVDSQGDKWKFVSS